MLPEEAEDLESEQVFYDQFCFDLLKAFGTDSLENFTKSSFSDTMRQLFKIVTLKVVGNEVKLKDCS